MSKNKVIELVVCMIALIILALTVTTNIFAADINALASDYNNTGFEEIPNNTFNFNNAVGNNNVNQNYNIVAPVNNSVNNAVNNTANNVNNNVNNNTSGEMPYTGLDNSVIFIIAISAISAVYAYKKIRDYNNI